MENQNNNSKQDQIEDLKMTIRICEHVIATEDLSLSGQEILANRIESCELQIGIILEEMKRPSVSDIINAICNPKNLSHV